MNKKIELEKALQCLYLEAPKNVVDDIKIIFENAINSAVEAETERCTKIVEDVLCTNKMIPYSKDIMAIIKTIRKYNE